MALTEIAYKRDSAGKLRSWQAEWEGSSYRIIAGLVGGSLVTSAWTTCTGKQGRTHDQQAEFEAKAELRKKLDREYRLDQADLDSVPPSPMLAQDFAKMKGPLPPVFWSQPKLDGIRAFFSRHGAFSREYQRHLNVEHIEQALAPVFAKNPDLILDGELYNHDLKDDFNKITSIVRKQKPTDEQRAEAKHLIQYHVYDAAVPKLDFEARNGLLFDALGEINSAAGYEVIKLVPTARCKTIMDLDELQAQYLQQGYEGQMVRFNAPYDFDKRSKNLLKRKEFITEEFPLIRVEEGQGNWAGYAKRVIYRLPNGGEGGAGLRGDQAFARNLLTRSINAEAIVTLRHFGLTPDGAHRFPVAIDFHFEGRRD